MAAMAYHADNGLGQGALDARLRPSYRHARIGKGVAGQDGGRSAAATAGGQRATRVAGEGDAEWAAAAKWCAGWVGLVRRSSGSGANQWQGVAQGSVEGVTAEVCTGCVTVRCSIQTVLSGQGCSRGVGHRW
jgi:hypothetical protein